VCVCVCVCVRVCVRACVLRRVFVCLEYRMSSRCTAPPQCGMVYVGSGGADPCAAGTSVTDAACPTELTCACAELHEPTIALGMCICASGVPCRTWS